jgi:hypothetical protein
VPSEPPPEEGEHELVSVCMASGAASVPYALEQFSATAIINGKGVAHKEGPANDPVVGVFPATPWGNIVPPVTHTSGKVFAGLNWDADGQRIWNAGCEYAVPAEPAPAPALAPSSAPAATDFCPDLDGVQWENYDCNTPQAVAAEVTVPAEPAIVVTAEPAAAVVPESVQPTAVTAPEAGTAPPVVAAPETATVPAAIPAGAGPGDPAAPVWAVCLFVLSCLSVAGSAARLVSSGASLR